MSSGRSLSATQLVWLERLSLVLLLAALPTAIVAYGDHFRIGTLPWWQWLIEMVAAAVMVTVAFGGDTAAIVEAPLRRWSRRACFPLAAICLAVAIRDGSVVGNELRTGILVVLALLLFVLGRWLPLSPTDVGCALGAERQPLPPLRRQTLLLWLGAVLCIGLELLVNDSQHLAGLLLWVAGLSLLAAGAWLSDRAVEPVAAPADCPQKMFEPSQRQQALLLLVVVLVAILFRFSQIADFPVLIDADEGRQGGWAVKIWRDGIPDFFAFGWNSFPNLAYSVEYALIPLVGQSYVALRLSSAIFGTLCVLLTFFWVRRWWGGVAGLLAAFLLAINQEHIYWSRVGFNNIHSAAVAALLMVAFTRVMQRGRWLDYVVLGYAAGAGFYTYHAAKLFPVLLVLPCLLLAFALPALVRRHLPGAAVSLFALALLVAPQGPWVYRNWDMFQRDTMNRFDTYLMFDAYKLGDLTTVRNHISSHVLDSLYVFISVPHKLSLFESWVGVPFVLGVIWMAWRWRDPRNMVMLAWLSGQLVIGSMLTGFPPNKPRLVGLLPIACAVPAVLAAEVYRRLRQILGERGEWVIVPFLGCWLACAAYSNWYTQFVHMAFLQSADVESFILRKITSIPQPAVVYMLGADASLSPRHALVDAVMTKPPQLTLINLPMDPDAVPLPPLPTGHALILVSKYQKELAPLVRYYYPDAPQEIVRSTDGADLMYAYSIDSAALTRARTLTATYREADGKVTTRITPINETAVFYPPEDLTFPVDSIWRGQLWVENPGKYHFKVNRGRLQIGWRDWLASDATDSDRVVADLPAGWHPIRIQASAVGSSKDVVTLEWRKGDEPNWRGFPREALSSHARPVALLGRYFARSESAPTDELVREQLHPALSFDWQAFDDDDPPLWFFQTGSKAEWVGSVDLALAEQPLRLETTVPTKIYIDDKLVMDVVGERNFKATTTVRVVPGRVRLRIEAIRPAARISEFWKLRLLWGTPGGGWSGFADYQPPPDAAGTTTSESAGRDDRAGSRREN